MAFTCTDFPRLRRKLTFVSLPSKMPDGLHSSWEGRTQLPPLWMGTGAPSSLAEGAKEPALSQGLGWGVGLPDPNPWLPRSHVHRNYVSRNSTRFSTPFNELLTENSILLSDILWVANSRHLTWSLRETCADPNRSIIQFLGFGVLQPPINWFCDL